MQLRDRNLIRVSYKLSDAFAVKKHASNKRHANQPRKKKWRNKQCSIRELWQDTENLHAKESAQVLSGTVRAHSVLGGVLSKSEPRTFSRETHKTAVLRFQEDRLSLVSDDDPPFPKWRKTRKREFFTNKFKEQKWSDGSHLCLASYKPSKLLVHSCFSHENSSPVQVTHPTNRRKRKSDQTEGLFDAKLVVDIPSLDGVEISSEGNIIIDLATKNSPSHNNSNMLGPSALKERGCPLFENSGACFENRSKTVAELNFINQPNFLLTESERASCTLSYSARCKENFATSLCPSPSASQPKKSKTTSRADFHSLGNWSIRGSDTLNKVLSVTAREKGSSEFMNGSSSTLKEKRDESTVVKKGRGTRPKRKKVRAKVLKPEQSKRVPKAKVSKARERRQHSKPRRQRKDDRGALGNMSETGKKGMQNDDISRSQSCRTVGVAESPTQHETQHETLHSPKTMRYRNVLRSMSQTVVKAESYSDKIFKRFTKKKRSKRNRNSLQQSDRHNGNFSIVLYEDVRPIGYLTEEPCDPPCISQGHTHSSDSDIQWCEECARSSRHPTRKYFSNLLMDVCSSSEAQLTVHEGSDFLSYDVEERSIAPFETGNELATGNRCYDLIPYEEAFDPTSRKKLKPKVLLDAETNRVFNLLMGIGDIKDCEEDEETKEHWERQRNVFKDRAESFIACMRVLQGDRHFSPWKGSVVDSVIGAFLTQNVSDHLSSSAFISLSSRFPGDSYIAEAGIFSGISVENHAASLRNIGGLISDTGVQNIGHNLYPMAREMDQSVNSKVLSSYNCEVRTQFQQIIKVDLPSSISLLTENEDSSITNDSLEHIIVGISDLQMNENRGLCIEEQAYAETDLKLALIELPEKALDLSKTNDKEIGHAMGKNEVYLESELNLALCMVTGDDPHKSRMGAKGTKGDMKIKGSYSESDLNLSLNTVPENCSASLKTDVSGVKHDQKINQSCHKRISINIVHETSTKNIGVDDGGNKVKVASGSKIGGIARANIEMTEQKSKNKLNWDAIKGDIRGDYSCRTERDRDPKSKDAVNWDAVRCADLEDIADAIKDRGMNNMLAGRIKRFLEQLHADAGTIDLEWLKSVTPDEAKNFLLSIRGLGLKSVECIRLLTLHQLAFPVDTNVGRICVRLGWVPIEPLPESVQLHLLEQYPILDSIQRYLWPRLCKLDRTTLYELHYQMITFGKVFCTKSKPNCNACPMSTQCKHYASACASARLALPDTRNMFTSDSTALQLSSEHYTNALMETSTPLDPNYSMGTFFPNNSLTRVPMQLLDIPLGPEYFEEAYSHHYQYEPIIEEPASPEQAYVDTSESAVDDATIPENDEMATINLSFSIPHDSASSISNGIQYLEDSESFATSKAVVPLSPKAASIPVRKLKRISRLRTEHHVYELPDNHSLLRGLEQRDPDDPCFYLLAIWSPDEVTENSISIESCCTTSSSENSNNDMAVKGTLLIPCRTATRGRFPLNGTYFQVNEVFADHETSFNPLKVPRGCIWNLRRRTVYFGTSVTSIFRGLTAEEIHECFWKGYVCVRAFDRKSRAPKPLMSRLHFPASKKGKENSEKKADEKKRI